MDGASVAIPPPKRGKRRKTARLILFEYLGGEKTQNNWG